MTTSIEGVFRRESGRVVATLIRFCGDFDLAEDAVQDAFMLALRLWAIDGIPPNAGGWIATVAKRRAIDLIRREARRTDKETLVSRLETMPEDLDDWPDDRLRLIFTCCHPALSLDARVALTLRTVCGLSTAEVGRAFLTSEATIAQRLVRAKHKIKVAGIAYEVPGPERLTERLGAVLAVVYLLFNEGYAASAGPQLVRDELCDEALRLGALLHELMPTEPEVGGLQALMLLNHARRAARTGPTGDLVLLADQDRSRWDTGEIEAGLALLRRAARAGSVGQYWLQAAIVAEHDRATTAEATDWPRVCQLYEHLLSITRSPIVALNRAIAVSMADGPAAGLRLLEPLSRQLDRYVYLHVARADMQSRLGNQAASAAAYQRAHDLAANEVQRAALRRRLEAALSADG
jgi:RNA polymerase sigma-70 factor (ECF subfamily)